MPALTKRQIESTQPGAKDVFLWDTTVHGFGVRIAPTGRRSFLVEYRLPNGRQRRRILGAYPLLTVEQARKKARAWMVAAQEGDDPAERKDLERRAETVAELADDYLKDYATVHKKKRSYKEDHSLIENHIKPKLGALKAASVSRRDVHRFHRDMHLTPYLANRAVACLSKMFNFNKEDLRNIKSGWVNPCQNVPRYPEEERTRYLSPLELTALGDVLEYAQTEGHCTPVAISAVRLLLFTGCRSSEVFNLRWDEVDFERQVLRLDDAKDGAREVFLSVPAIEILKGVKKGAKGPYVLPSPVLPNAPIQTIKKSWKRLREMATVLLWLRCDDPEVSNVVSDLWEKGGCMPSLQVCQRTLEAHLGKGYPLPAGMTDVRPHDLRHSYASVGVNSGLSLSIIGKLLGHQQVSTTARYAHIAAEPAHNAAGLIGSLVAEAMGGTLSKAKKGNGAKVAKFSLPRR